MLDLVKPTEKETPLSQLPSKYSILNHEVPPLFVYKKHLEIHPTATKALQLLGGNDCLGLIYGGAVRDHLRGKKFNDIDMITNAPLEKLQQIFGGYITSTYENCATVKCNMLRVDGD